MSLVIPDQVIVNTLNLALTAIRNDYRTAIERGQENRSLLYLLFNSLSLGRYDYYENVKQLIITTPEDPKHLDVSLSYDKNIAKVNHVFVTLPSENEKNNSLAIGAGNYEELTYNNTEGDTQRTQYSRRYSSTYYVVIICENRNEMIVLYNLFMAIIINCINHFDLEGLENLKTGGQDLRFQSIPDGIFQRAITLNFEFERVIPELQFNDIIRTIRLYWRPEDAITRQGPIEFSTEDDIASESSGS